MTLAYQIKVGAQPGMLTEKQPEIFGRNFLQIVTAI